jgi:hypothetical protein
MRWIVYYVEGDKVGSKLVRYLSAGGYSTDKAMAMRYRHKQVAEAAAQGAKLALRQAHRVEFPFYVQEVER